MSDESKYCVRCESYHPKSQECFLQVRPSELAQARGSALRRSFSQEEIVTAAREWIRTHYPDSDPDTRMARLGLLIEFLTDIVPNNH